MPRTLGGSLGTAITQPITSPGYLVYLGFDPVLRYSTRETVSYGGYSWTGEVGAQVAAVSEAAAQITLRNTDLSASSLVLNNVLADIQCVIYKRYGADAALLFDGYLDGATVGERVTLNAKAMATARKVPNKYITYPTFNFLIPPGTQIRWGLDTITLEASG